MCHKLLRPWTWRLKGIAALLAVGFSLPWFSLPACIEFTGLPMPFLRLLHSGVAVILYIGAVLIVLSWISDEEVRRLSIAIGVGLLAAGALLVALPGFLIFASNADALWDGSLFTMRSVFRHEIECLHGGMKWGEVHEALRALPGRGFSERRFPDGIWIEGRNTVEAFPAAEGGQYLLIFQEDMVLAEIRYSRSGSDRGSVVVGPLHSRPTSLPSP